MASIYGAQSAHGWQLRLDYTVAQSVADNQSTVAMTLYILDGTGYSENLSANSCYYTLYDGARVYQPYSYTDAQKGTWIALGSRTVTVPHNADGTKSVTLSGYWASGFSSQWTPSELSVSGTVALPAIPRASTMSWTPERPGLGSRVTFSIAAADAALRHKLSVRFGSRTAVLLENNVQGGWWDIPAVWGDQIPAAMTGAATFTLETYSGGTRIGSRTYTATLTVPDYTPAAALTAAPVNDNDTVRGWGVAVKGYSALAWTVTAGSSYGAQVSSYSVSIGGQRGTAAEGVTGPLTVSGTVTPSATVKDSRGKAVTVTAAAVTVYDYAAPWVKGSAAYRAATSDGGASDDGAYLRAMLHAGHSGVGGRNVLTVQGRWRARGGSWSGWTALTNGAVKTLKNDLSPTVSYEVQLRATDSLGNSRSVTVPVSTAAVTFHLKCGGSGAAFGKYAETADTLETAWALKPTAAARGRSAKNLTAGETFTGSADDVTESGCYWLTDGNTGKPEGVTYGHLLHVSGYAAAGDRRGMQILAAYTGGAPRLYVRHYANEQWYPWGLCVSDTDLTTEVLNRNYLNMNCARHGTVKFIRCSTTPNAAMSSGESYPVGTLSQRFRPTYNITHYVIGSSGTVQGYLYLSTGGNVTFRALTNIPTSTGININLAYL